MSGKFFLDTNVFIYSFESRTPRKQARAQNLIESGLKTHRGTISTQVVQEFLNVATKKFANPLSVPDSYRYLDFVLAPLCEVFPTITLYRQALEIHAETGYSVYDSLIIGAALQAKCEILYSEDFHHNHQFRNVQIINPFHSKA